MAMTRGEVKAYLGRFLVALVQEAEQDGVKSTSVEASVTRWRGDLEQEMYRLATATPREQALELLGTWWPELKGHALATIGNVTVTRARGRQNYTDLGGHRGGSGRASIPDRARKSAQAGR